MLTSFPCPPPKLALVVVDWWDYHWCKTYAAHLAQMRPRLNRTASALRERGATIIWAPTDTVWWYEHWPRRLAVKCLPVADVPHARDFSVDWHVPHQTCHCGPGIPCTFNLTHRSLDPAIMIAPEDWIVANERELYAVCISLGLTHLCYAGAALNACVTHKDIGIATMWAAGLPCFTAEHLTMAWSTYDPHNAFTPTRGSAIARQDLANAGIRPMDLLTCCGQAEADCNLWPTWITPSGHPDRPHFFHADARVTIETTQGPEIRYRFGGPPSADSPRYDEPLLVDNTCDLWAATFDGAHQLSRLAFSRFCRIDEGLHS
jgi:hypothetical protein